MLKRDQLQSSTGHTLGDAPRSKCTGSERERGASLRPDRFAISRDLMGEVQAYAITVARQIPVGARGFPEYLRYALLAVVAATNPRRKLADVAGFILRAGGELLLLFPELDAIRRHHDIVIAANDRAALAWFGSPWFDVSAGPSGTRNQKFSLAPCEQAGIAALDRLVELRSRPALALCCMAALVGMEAVPAESPTADARRPSALPKGTARASRHGRGVRRAGEGQATAGRMRREL